MKQSTSYEIQRVLQEMREEYWRGLDAVEEAAIGETADYLVLRLGGERFGFATSLTREVLRAPKLVRVPQVPSHIRGVINLRGQIVAVTDLAQVLGLGETVVTAGTRLVVVEAGGLTTALLSDEVLGIETFPLAAIEPLTEGLARIPRETVLGQVPRADGMLVLLDLPRLFSHSQFVIEQKGD
ncbi:chemotaxis protein CheW [Desulfuromonas carbonis]|uniref:chemotaxis protein CheW n=1 Tax=Desulfuromonas sp. DDH964 TaxID=1823759 RepID=UPI00078D721B|nr:chemotaxis protein CheW [Desulfuromonas sp. DDH964]AMV70795.1 scaffold protein CheW associated with MCPs of class 34H [Desulfuromonas sp. DDH964]